MTLLTIGEAAARLHTTTSTLRSWERRLGFPLPARSVSGRRMYEESTVMLLGDALARGLSISSAVREVREQTGSHAALLADELAALRFEAGERVLLAAIAMRGVSRAFDEVVLAAIDAVVERATPGIAALAFAWVGDHALHYRRLATTLAHSKVVVADGSEETDPLRAASDILQLQLAFRGITTHTLRGTAVREAATIAQLTNASAVLVVGGIVDMLASPLTGVETVAAFGADGALGGEPVVRLSPRPRQAAEELSGLAARTALRPIDGNASNGARPADPRAEAALAVGAPGEPRSARAPRRAAAPRAS
jgi:DNA-binding transcriptional MerR regulator